jgi:tetratricopeptide (TPR) repeat protein/tRNA A-37 threonylcarbamoyl transferase component Bud32
MAEDKFCPKCGAPLRVEAGTTSCPACALRGYFEPVAALRGCGSGEPPQAQAAGAEPSLGLGPSPAPLPEHAAPLATLRYFGDYELLEEIARGGMGVVYRARQVSLNRTVAVKMILAGQLASRADVHRFRAEAEAAANLQHPNIVAIHEVGEHEGQHYFSMDYVEGRNLAQAISEDGSGVSDFQRAASCIKTIAEAIHFAHQRGVLHRDLKPSNILLDAASQPRITDFGLAKRLTEPRPSSPDPQLTLTGQVLGSPNYMPPEQAQGRRRQATVASDIYSLGAILYHLLTGRPPFVAETLAETFQQLLNTEPVAPRLLNHKVPRDLETICLKCLEKAPPRRYDTANALAVDLGRFLNHEPVAARPPSRLYRFQKLVRRNKLVFSAAAAITAALVAGLGVAMWGLARERAARKAAQAQARRSDQVAQFLKDMVQGVDPSVAAGRDTTVLQEILDKTVERLDRDLKGQPLVEAELREIIGIVYQELADYPKEEAMIRRVLDLRRGTPGVKAVDLARALNNWGTLLERQGKVSQAEPPLREAQTMLLKAQTGDDSLLAQIENNLGCLLNDQGKAAEAEGWHRRALVRRKKLHPEGDHDVLQSLSSLGAVLTELGRYPEAEAQLREAVDTGRKVSGGGTPLLAVVLDNLGAVLVDEGKLPPAEPLYREALDLQKRLLGEDHPDVAGTLNLLGLLLDLEGRPTEAEVYLRRSLSVNQRRPGENPLVCSSMSSLAQVLAHEGEYTEAESLQRQALEMQKKFLGEENLEIAVSLNRLAFMLMAQRKYDEAEASVRRALAMGRKLLGNENPWVAGFLSGLTEILAERGSLAEAEDVGRQALEMGKEQFGQDHPAVADTLHDLGTLMSREGRYVEAEQSHRQALAIRQKRLDSSHPRVTLSMQALAWVLHRQGRYAEAESLYREVHERSRARSRAEQENVLGAMADLATVLADWVWTECGPLSAGGRPQPDLQRCAEEAESLLRECLATQLNGTNASGWRTDGVRSRLGGALVSVSVADPGESPEFAGARFTEAEGLLLEAYGGLLPRELVERWTKSDCLERLVRLYEAWDIYAPNTGKSTQAQEWKNKLEAFRAESEEILAKQRTGPPDQKGPKVTER